MKKINITKRDITFFFLGILAFIVLDAIYNWPDAKQDFMDGWNGTQSEVKK